MPETVSQFHLSVPKSQLTDLRERLQRTRFSSKETVGDTSQGPQLEAMVRLHEHWLTQYDWRSVKLS